MTITQIRSGNATFTAVKDAFGMDKGGSDREIKFKGNSIYTNSKISTALFQSRSGLDALRAKFSKSDGVKPETRLQLREGKIKEGVENIKRAIDREFGPGTADRAFAHIRSTGARGAPPRDLDSGIMRSDLASIDRAIAATSAPLDRATVARAVNSPDIRNGTNNVSASALGRFISRNFEVCAHPSFWKRDDIKGSIDVIGSTMALTVLRRVFLSNVTAPKNLQDLSAALDPLNGKRSAPGELHEDLSPDQVGGLDEKTKNDLLDVVYENFFKPLPEGGTDDGRDAVLNMSVGLEKQCRALADDRASGRVSADGSLDRLERLHASILQGCGNIDDRIRGALTSIR